MRSLLRRLPSHALVAGSAWGGRLVIAVTQLVSIPLLIRYLGAEGYSLFAVAMSLQAWWLLTDIGIANSLQNYVSERRASSRGYADLVVNAAAVIVPIAIVCIVLLYFFAGELAAALLPNVPSMPLQGAALMVCSGVLFLLLTIGNIAYKIFYAQHQGYWANLLPAFGSVIGLACLVFVDCFVIVDKLFWATLLWNGPTALLASGAFILLVVRALKSREGKFNVRLTLTLLRRGSQFGIFALLAALTLQIDYIVIGKLMSAREVMLYNISTKMLGFVSFFYLAIIQALWPICAEAAARKDWSKASALFRKALFLGAVIVLSGSAVLWLLHDQFVELLAPTQGLIIPFSFWSLLTFYALVRVWSDGYAMLLQSMSRMNIFMYYVPVQALICALGQWVLGSYFGLSGIVLGLIASFLLTSVWLLPKEYRKATLS